MSLIVSNTAPLIALADIGQLEVLRRLLGSVTIPPAVRAEVLNEPGVSAIQSAITEGWLLVQATRDTLAVQMLREDFGLGESEAIILAQETQAHWIILDDLAARHRAQRLGLAVIGTLGVLLMAKESGDLTPLKPWLELLREKNFRMSAALYQQILKDAREADSSP